jgi:hypothetical protein
MGSQPKDRRRRQTEKRSPAKGSRPGFRKPEEMSSEEDGPAGRMPSQRPDPTGSSGNAQARDVLAQARLAGKT